MDGFGMFCELSSWDDLLQTEQHHLRLSMSSNCRPQAFIKARFMVASERAAFASSMMMPSKIQCRGKMVECIETIIT